MQAVSPDGGQHIARARVSPEHKEIGTNTEDNNCLVRDPVALAKSDIRVKPKLVT